MAQLDLLNHGHRCRYCGVELHPVREHECDPEAMKAVIDAHDERWSGTRLLALNLIGRLDVMMPKVEGVVTFQSLRSGQPAYDGPDPTPWIEKMRDYCRLTDHGRMTERDFWPVDYCRTCDGSGNVMPGEGIVPLRAQLGLELCVRSVLDRAAAHRLLRKRDPEMPATDALALLDRMEEGEPIPVFREGWVQDAAIMRQWVELGVEFVYRRDIVSPCYDICPRCKGTANRGLPEGTPLQFSPTWPEAPVELNLRERQADGTYSEMSRERFEELFRVFVRREKD